MDTVISFTPGTLIVAILGICGGIITLSNGAKVLLDLFGVIKAPEARQNEEIENLKKEIKMIKEQISDHEKFFKQDNERLETIETGNRVVLTSMLALLSHSIDGNNVEEMKAAKKNLEEYLINKS